MTEPIPMLLSCPKCKASHIDEGEWATRLHKTHLCAGCGWTWKPALVPTVGVRSLTEFSDLPVDAPLSDAEKVQLLTRFIDDTGRIVTPDWDAKKRDRSQLPEMVLVLKELVDERRKIGIDASNEIRELRNELSEIGKVVAEFNVHDESQTPLDRVRCMASMYGDKQKLAERCLKGFDAIAVALYPEFADGLEARMYNTAEFPKDIRDLRDRAERNAKFSAETVALNARIAELEAGTEEWCELQDKLETILDSPVGIVEATRAAVRGAREGYKLEPIARDRALIEALDKDLRALRNRLLDEGPYRHNPLGDRLERSSLLATIQKSIDKVRDWENPAPKLDKLKVLMRSPRPDEAVGDQSKLTEQVRSVNPESLALAAQLPTDAADERVVDALIAKRAGELDTRPLGPDRTARDLKALDGLHIIMRARDPRTGNWRVSDSTTIPALGKCYSDTESCVGRGAVPISA